MPFFIQIAPAAQEVPKTQIEFYQGKETRDKLCVDSDLQSVRLDDDLLEDGYTKDRLNYLVSEWEQNTIFLSSVQQIVEDDNFKKIVSMGRKAIPYIIEKIDKEPSPLVWALNLITNSHLQIGYRITVTDACKLWVKLWKQGKI